ncbi:MAG: GPP34 family phosphoprotein [Acetobacteraceae bacterium]
MTLADEIVVLLLDDEVGDVALVHRPIATIAAIGGVLMELALRLRIDTDPDRLFVIDPADTGDSLLDDVLREIAAAEGTQPTAWWVDALAGRHSHILDQVMHRLVEAGILRQEERRFLWVFSRRAYPPVSGRERLEAKARLMTILFNDDVPDPRDTLLLGLANASGVLSRMLSAAEFERAAARIAQIANLEEIGRSVATVCRQVLDALGVTARNYPV